MILPLRRVVRLLPLLALFAFCSSCGNFFVSNSSVQTVTVSPTAVMLAAASSASTPGDTKTLKSSATTVGGTTTDNTAASTWTSSAPEIATVVAGKVTAVGLTGGSTATITAKDSGQSGTATVLLYTGAAPTSLSVSPQNTTLVPSSIAPGMVFQMQAFAGINGQTNFNVTNDVTWTSSNTTFAPVNASGLVTVTSNATAGTTFTITATANFGDSASTSTATGQSTTFTILGGTIF